MSKKNQKRKKVRKQRKMVPRYKCGKPIVPIAALAGPPP